MYSCCVARWLCNSFCVIQRYGHKNEYVDNEMSLFRVIGPLDKHASLERFQLLTVGQDSAYRAFCSKVALPWLGSCTGDFAPYTFEYPPRGGFGVKSGAFGYETQDENAAGQKVLGNKHVLRIA
jgi:hypothetical protein